MANFLDAQGYKLLNNIVLQDNMSAMKMERNGRSSCTGNSRHIDIRFFFTKDRYDNKEISIEHCPTEEMLSDFYTKPQQGSLFHKMRAVLMGWASLDSLKKIDTTTNFDNNDLQSSPMKERVEDGENRLIEDNGKDSIRNKGVLTYRDVVQIASRNSLHPNMAVV